MGLCIAGIAVSRLVSFGSTLRVLIVHRPYRPRCSLSSATPKRWRISSSVEMALFISILCWMIGWVLTIPAHAQLGIALAPMRQEIKIAAGSQHTDTLRLSNDSAAHTRVKAEILDFYMDDKMTPQFGESYEREAKYSCSKWLQINPRESELDGGASIRVRYTLQVPAGTPEGEFHCGAGFVTVPPVSKSEAPMGVQMAVEAVSAFYVVIGNPSSRPSLKDLSLKTLPDGSLQVLALFENQGLKTFRVKGFVEVRNAKGESVERAEYTAIPVLPERQQQFLLPLKSALTPGTYTLYTQADVGLPEIFEGSVSVELRSVP
jgi:hypothetical protein